MEPKRPEPEVERTPRSRTDPGAGAADAGGWSARIARHPVITATFVVCTLGGAIAGVALLTGDWSVARRLAAGAVGGASIGLLITATKMLG